MGVSSVIRSLREWMERRTAGRRAAGLLPLMFRGFVLDSVLFLFALVLKRGELVFLDCASLKLWGSFVEERAIMQRSFSG